MRSIPGQLQINIKIGNKAPLTYFGDIASQCNGGPLKYGAIADQETLRENLAANCVPEAIANLEVAQFDEFLRARRLQMAKKIRHYYENL